MRPFRKNSSPIKGDYDDYEDAKTELISRFGSGWSNSKHIASYCSYCERAIGTNLAVEHIEPKKGPYGKPALIGNWNNFLLACVNCNSTKKDKQVILKDIFLPDRDNTLSAFEYKADGTIGAASHLTGPDIDKAVKTLELVGLNKELRETYDDHKHLIAQDRASQRLQVWGLAEDTLRDDYLPNTTNQTVKNLIVKVMLTSGFFSVWMTVFDKYADMKNMFIDAINGTRESNCFDAHANLISPHPNQDKLQDGSKI